MPVEHIKLQDNIYVERTVNSYGISGLQINTVDNWCVHVHTYNKYIDHIAEKIFSSQILLPEFIQVFLVLFFCEWNRKYQEKLTNQSTAQ